MYKYEMTPTRTVGTTEWTRVAGRTDGRSEINIPPPPPNNILRGYNATKLLAFKAFILWIVVPGLHKSHMSVSWAMLYAAHHRSYPFTDLHFTIHTM